MRSSVKSEKLEDLNLDKRISSTLAVIEEKSIKPQIDSQSASSGDENQKNDEPSKSDISSQDDGEIYDFKELGA